MDELLFQGTHLNFLNSNGWEYVARRNCSGIVVVIPLTDDDSVILVEQYRPPVGQRVIEFPSGLVNDRKGAPKETREEAANRELAEEIGYVADKLNLLTEGPPSAGLSSELITFYKGSNLIRVSEGGGDSSEALTIHEVPLAEIKDWIGQQEQRGVWIDPKVYTGLFFLSK